MRREKQHHPLTHQKGFSPQKSKSVPLFTTIHPICEYAFKTQQREREREERKEKARETVCFFSVLSYTYPTTLHFLPFFILDFNQSIAEMSVLVTLFSTNSKHDLMLPASPLHDELIFQFVFTIIQSVLIRYYHITIQILVPEMKNQIFTMHLFFCQANNN